MNWYWIILIVIGYLLIWIITAVIDVRTSWSNDTDTAAFLGLFWPLTLPILLVNRVVGKIDDWLDERAIAKKQMERMLKENSHD